MKLNYKRTFLIGTGFMSCMLLWSVYNSFVPVILRGKLTEVFAGDSAFAQFISTHPWMSWVSVALIVNAIMTIDNITLYKENEATAHITAYVTTSTPLNSAERRRKSRMRPFRFASPKRNALFATRDTTW